MSSGVVTLDKASWAEVVNVSISDMAKDKVGGLYVRQCASAVVHPNVLDDHVVGVARTAYGYVTRTSAEDIKRMFGENVVSITAPVDFNVITEWHKLRSKN